MAAQTLMSSQAQAPGSHQQSRPVARAPFLLQPRIAHITARRHSTTPASYSGQCGPNFGGVKGTFGWGPGFVGNTSMADVMNKPLSEVLRQLERDFNAAAQQARQQQSSSGSSGSSGQSNISSATMRLPVDTVEKEDAFFFFTDLPGLEKKDLKIQVNKEARTVTLSGERVQPLTGEDEAKLKRSMQRRFGKFSHVINLPEDADAQQISAKVDQGVLRIKVAKVVKPEPEIQTVTVD